MHVIPIVKKTTHPIYRKHQQIIESEIMTFRRKGAVCSLIQQRAKGLEAVEYMLKEPGFGAGRGREREAVA